MVAKRLIEVAFPLKQAPLDAVGEKNVRDGRVSTVHIWPARQPLATYREALIHALVVPVCDRQGSRAFRRRSGSARRTGRGRIRRSDPAPK